MILMKISFLLNQLLHVMLLIWNEQKGII